MRLVVLSLSHTLFGGFVRVFLQAIAEQSRIVRLPLNQVGAISKINQVTNEFVQQHNRRPSIHELAELTGIDEARIRQSQSADTTT